MHCGAVVDAALEAKEAAELDALDDDAREVEYTNFARSHALSKKGKVPIGPYDPSERAPTALHRRINIIGNCIILTFMKVRAHARARLAHARPITLARIPHALRREHRPPA
eukprot:7376330-Prymnesium_polylepis.1